MRFPAVPTDWLALKHGGLLAHQRVEAGYVWNGDHGVLCACAWVCMRACCAYSICIRPRPPERVEAGYVPNGDHEVLYACVGVRVCVCVRCACLICICLRPPEVEAGCVWNGGLKGYACECCVYLFLKKTYKELRQVWVVKRNN